MKQRTKRMMIALAIVLVASIAAVAVILARRASARPNVILISIDTLRADHLGCYGYGKATSPSIDSFSRESVVFNTAIAPAPSTLPSHASIFTSLAPQHHGASHTNAVPLAGGFVTLTEALRDSGYRTAALTGGAQLAPEYGLNQGFDSYEVAENDTLEQLVARAFPFMESRDRKPFFLFLHTYQVHHPYRPAPDDLARIEPDPHTKLPSNIEVKLLEQINAGVLAIDDGDKAHIVSAYDAQILAMDRGVRLLVGTLKRLGLYENTVIVFTSDHGEEFDEHGFMGWHSHTLYDELLRVPLIVRLPKGAHGGTRIDGMARSVDIAPMILAAAGVPLPEQFEKFSLAGAIARRRVPASAALLWMETPPGSTVRHSGLRTGEWKLVDGRLYDLGRDPREQIDISVLQPAITTELTDRMNALIGERPRPDTRAIAPDQQTIQHLRALGYLH